MKKHEPFDLSTRITIGIVIVIWIAMTLGMFYGIYALFKNYGFIIGCLVIGGIVALLMLCVHFMTLNAPLMEDPDYYSTDTGKKS